MSLSSSSLIVTGSSGRVGTDTGAEEQSKRDIGRISSSSSSFTSSFVVESVVVNAVRMDDCVCELRILYRDSASFFPSDMESRTLETKVSQSSDSGHSCWKKRDSPVRCHYLCIRPTIKFSMCLLRAQTVNTYNVRTASLAEGIPEAIEQSITLLMRLI